MNGVTVLVPQAGPVAAHETTLHPIGGHGPAGSLNICVVFATRGRPDILSAVVASLDHQTHRPASIILSCTSRDDAGVAAERSDVTLMIGPAGCCAQRNTALRHLPIDTHIVVFFDDDFVPHPNWLNAVAATFAARPDVSAITGRLIADGIKGPGLSFDDACEMIEAFGDKDFDAIEEHYSPYGCNMAFRVEALDGLTFDERLVLYGWLEDRDFGAALARRGGRSIKLGAALGVHLGIKTSRMPGNRLGYSQIVNPIYLFRKGHMSVRSVADHLGRNMLSNLFGSFAPEPYVDRRGRLRGNLVGIGDLVRGRVAPERAAQL
ncbi:glycosyltransferase family 2 protein [Lichenihabitans sp. PAMC28606]|uniref:glycosyltransferase family 2 protein n=1 Tax=Lichenihabitans sp. PAMC28606 TaxID=2880932 RepID=UPI001D0AB3C7|nr:glycosyltransferase family A protein [Lichenihabitans sp. PAMC28606]UDL94520.1 glycosyltransferase family 2 protein [Lichenihabitans sp. PAMC28606]